VKRTPSNKAFFDIHAMILERDLEGYDEAKVLSGDMGASHDDLLELVVSEVVNI